MALTVTSGMTLYSEHDAQEFDEGTSTLYIEGMRSGTGYVGYDVDIETLYNFNDVVAPPADMSNTHIGVWLRISNAGSVDTLAAGGMQIAVRDGTGNESYWYVGGSDTYAGGWVFFVAYTGNTPDAHNGTVATLTNTADLGVGFKMLAKSADDNCHIDAMYYGNSGLVVTGTVTTTGSGWQEVFDLVDSQADGLMAQQAGSFVLKAPVTLGDAVGTLSTNFSDTDSIIFFADLPVSSTFYKIDLGANGTGTTDVSFAGLVSKSVNLKALLDFSTSITSFIYKDSTALSQGNISFSGGTLSGNKYVGCGTTTLSAGSTTSNNTWDTSDQIILTTTATLTASDIIDNINAIALTCDTLARITDVSFTSDGTGHAVDLGTISSTISMNWNNTDSGYAATNGSTGNETILVSVDTGITLTINVGAGYSTPTYYNTGLGSVSVVSGQVTTKIIVKHSDGTLLTTQDANVLLEADTGGPLAEGTDIIKGLTDVTGEIQDIRSFASNQPVIGWVRKGSATPYYKEFPLQGTINNANGLTLTAQMIDDE